MSGNDFISVGGTIISGLIGLFTWGAILMLPILLMVRNCYFAFKRPKLTEEEHMSGPYRKVSEKKTDMVIILFGAFCSFLWISVLSSAPYTIHHDYNEATYVGQYHNFVHSEYGITVWLTLGIALAALTVLALVDPIKFPPLPQALCFGFAVIGEVVFAVLISQLAMNFTLLVLPLLYYLVNIIIVTAKLTRRYIREHLSYKEEHDTRYIHESAEPLEKALWNVASLTELHFIMILPAAVILVALYILLGQGPDGIIKAFTMTADWTFSTQTPPPPIDYEGHYLCTVAAGGHKKVVKPVRYGRRRGDIIVVNRQLLASNAFEDMIMERTPKFHRAVRSFYDKHGYPISRHITTQTRADMVYIIMKPLEWLFILCLYTFDAHPENRIAVQYSDYRK